MADRKRTAVYPPAEEDVPATTEQTAVDIEVLLNLSEDAVWVLQKRLLRQYFFALQRHFRSPSSSGVGTVTTTVTAITSSSSSQRAPQPHPQPQPQPQPQHRPQPDHPPPETSSRLLSLPPEIRRLILLHLLSPRPSTSSSSPSSSSLPPAPTRGPHPRGLQSPLLLALTLPPAVLRSCRALYAEGVAVLYGTQEVFASVDFDVWRHRRERVSAAVAVGCQVRSAVRRLHVMVFLGKEKGAAARRLGGVEREARLEEVRRGCRKLVAWLRVGGDGHGKGGGRGSGGGKEEGGGGLRSLRISWQEPPRTYTWEQKKTVLDEFRPLRAWTVEADEINWGLKYPGGRKFRFEEDYLRELGQARGREGGPSGGGPSEGRGQDEMDVEVEMSGV